MKKKILAFAMTALLALVLTGCGQGAVEKNDSELDEAIGTEAVEPSEGDAAEPADEQQPEKEAEAGKPASGATSKPAASYNSGNSSKPSSNGASSASKPQAPSHEHSWVHHDAVYIENPVCVSKLVCSCGNMYDTNSQWSEHVQSLGFGTDHSYSVRSVQVGTEKVLAEAEYWSCSCGATK